MLSGLRRSPAAFHRASEGPLRTTSAVLSESEPNEEGQDRENVEPDDEMANEQQIGEAPFMADAIALARLEKQKALRVAMTFLPSMWFKPFYILRVALEPDDTAHAIPH